MAGEITAIPTANKVKKISFFMIIHRKCLIGIEAVYPSGRKEIMKRNGSEIKIV